MSAGELYKAVKRIDRLGTSLYIDRNEAGASEL